jgi:hypothetical protein
VVFSIMDDALTITVAWLGDLDLGEDVAGDDFLAFSTCYDRSLNGPACP